MDRKTRFEDWLAQNIALICFIVFGGGAVLAAIVAGTAGASVRVLDRNNATITQTIRDAPAQGKVTNCKKATETINHKGLFGDVQVTTFHMLYFCYDGNHVFPIDAKRNCTPLNGTGWFVQNKQVKAYFRSWGDHNDGSRHDDLTCTYHRSVYNTTFWHTSEIVGLANGFVNFP